MRARSFNSILIKPEILFCVLASFLSAFCPVPATAQSLNEQKEAYREYVAVAKQTLLDVYIDQIAKKVAKGDLAGAGQLTEWKTHFENRNVLGGYEDAFAKEFRDYGAAIKKASDDLRAAYLSEVDRLKAANKSTEASDLLTELNEQRLLGDLVSLQQFRAKGFLKHFALDCYGCEPVNNGEKMNATFEFTSGLSESVHTSIRAVNWPDSYIDHFGFRIKLTQLRDDLGWKMHATWLQKPGLADAKNAVSFESVSHPGRYIRIRPNGEAWLDRFEETHAFRASATFYVKKPLFKMW